MFKKESTADSKTISTLRKKSLLLSRSSLRWKKGGIRRSSNFWSSQLRFVSSNCFFFSNASIRLLTKLASAASAGKFQAMTKPMITSEPAVPSTLLLGLYPSNTLRMLNKDLTRSRRVFSSVPKPSKRRKGSAGRVNNNRAHAGGGAGGPRAPPLFEKWTNKCKYSGTPHIKNCSAGPEIRRRCFFHPKHWSEKRTQRWRSKKNLALRFSWLYLPSK